MGALRYVLDTCTFLWLCAEPKRLGKRARRAAAARESELLLSDVCVLEITLKWLAGKIELPAPPRIWVEEQAAKWHTTRVPVSREAIYRSGELPSVHKDPFDRLLIATAIEENAAIVTPDEWIHKYPVAWIW